MRDKWGWDTEYVLLWFFIPAIIAVVLVVGDFKTNTGTTGSPWWLLIGFAGVPAAVIYRVVGGKVRALKTRCASESGEVAESLMVIGKIQSPGVVILDGEELRMIPIVGKPRTFSLSEIEMMKVGGWLPGKKLIGKTVFNFTVPGHKRLGFAVTRSVGERWSPRLLGAAKAVVP